MISNQNNKFVMCTNLKLGIIFSISKFKIVLFRIMLKKFIKTENFFHSEYENTKYYVRKLIHYIL